MTGTRFSRAVLFVVTVGVLGGFARPASAQVFLSPIAGYNFGGDSGCPKITGCDNKNINLGLAFGNYGDLFGIEEEFSYAKDFYGNAASYESSLVTIMTNLLIVPDVSRVKVYGLIGIGVIKSNVEFGTLSALTSKSNVLTWDIGGGVSGQLSDRFGLRGDLRFFRTLKDLNIGGLSLQGSKIQFARVGVGLMIFF